MKFFFIALSILVFSGCDSNGFSSEPGRRKIISSETSSATGSGSDQVIATGGSDAGTTSGNTAAASGAGTGSTEGNSGATTGQSPAAATPAANTTATNTTVSNTTISNTTITNTNVTNTTTSASTSTTPKICTRKVTKEFNDGVGIIINSKNYSGDTTGQCNTSCHWAGKGYTGCSYRPCLIPGTTDDSQCLKCIYTKEVDEQYPC